MAGVVTWTLAGVVTFVTDTVEGARGTTDAVVFAVVAVGLTEEGAVAAGDDLAGTMGADACTAGFDVARLLEVVTASAASMRRTTVTTRTRTRGCRAI
ncbi:hypothetical protein [Deinococcus yavapaiensis]|uniref:hypothetical protein n=1 Tax=Deinococcus yavapaiensis TaxID=309889 RepID=UPI0011B74D32|nr:hypothetical protein [Deinococcus yavapaiensis]